MTTELINWIAILVANIARNEVTTLLKCKWARKWKRKGVDETPVWPAVLWVQKKSSVIVKKHPCIVTSEPKNNQTF